MTAKPDAFAEAATKRGHALVVVAGDVGRSPRMQYHALSLAEEGRAVTLVGYAGERCIDALVRHACVREVRIAEPSRRFPGFLGRVYRLLALCFALGRALFKARRDYRASLVLCQTPPALPALFLCWLVARRDGAHVVADWHNLGHTVLADASLRRKGRLSFADRVAVGIYDFLERRSGRLLDRHLCVTHALKAWLSRNYGIHAEAAHDRPPSMFTSLSESERLAALARIGSIAFPSSSNDPFWRGRSLADASKDRPTLVEERRPSRDEASAPALTAAGLRNPWGGLSAGIRRHSRRRTWSLSKAGPCADPTRGARRCLASCSGASRAICRARPTFYFRGALRGCGELALAETSGSSGGPRGVAPSTAAGSCLCCAGD